MYVGGRERGGGEVGREREREREEMGQGRADRTNQIAVIVKKRCYPKCESAVCIPRQ